MVKQKIQNLVIFGGSMEDVRIVYGHLVSLTAMWYTSWIFGIFCANMVPIFFIRLGTPCQEKSGNPDLALLSRGMAPGPP
jgi:hypothetical protein